VDNTLNRQFDVGAPNQFWFSYIIGIKTNEGFSHLAIVIGLYPQRVVDGRVATSGESCDAAFGWGLNVGFGPFPAKYKILGKFPKLC